MSTYTFQTVVNGKVIKESTLKINAGSKLIAKPHNDVPIRDIQGIHESLSKGLESDNKLLIIPPWLDLQVLDQEIDPE